MSGRTKHQTRTVLTGRALTRTRHPVKRPTPVEVDWSLVHQLRAPARVDGTTLSPKGTCYDCDRPVSGNRKFCGPCLTKHPYNP